MMKCTLLTVTVIVALVATLGCKNRVEENALSTSKEVLIKRGEYLVTISGCGDCHSPKVMTNMGPVPDTTKLFSGHRSDAKPLEISTDAFNKGWVLFNNENTVLATPMFVSYAANISSDATGIGNWNFNQFKKAITQGKWKGIDSNRELLPPMPWPNYSKMTEADLLAIFEFLKTTKPIKNIVPNAVVIRQ